MKYIDADLLQQKLIERLGLFEKLSSDTISPIRIDECKKIISIIDSLQQEQPEKGLDVTEFCKPIAPGIAKCVADHWWELLDDKDSEEKQPEVDIATEYDEQFNSDPVYGKLANRNAGIAIARHFYELGKNSK